MDTRSRNVLINIEKHFVYCDMRISQIIQLGLLIDNIVAALQNIGFECHHAHL